MKIYFTFTYCNGKDQIEVKVTNRVTGAFCEISRCPINTVLEIFEEVPPAQLTWVSEDKNGAKLCVPCDIVENFYYRCLPASSLRAFIKALIKGSTCPI